MRGTGALLLPAKKKNRDTSCAIFEGLFKVSSTIGFKLLQKQGWTQGTTGLGASQQGRLEPVQVYLKDNRRGLGADMSETRFSPVSEHESSQKSDKEEESIRKHVVVPNSSAAINSSNIGFQLLKKHGWKEGTGLGISEQGRLEPVQTYLKNNKRGVGADKVPKALKTPESSALNH